MNNNRGNGHLSHKIGLNQPGRPGGAYSCGFEGVGYLNKKSSKAASKPKTINHRVAIGNGGRKNKNKITLAKVNLP